MGTYVASPSRVLVFASLVFLPSSAVAALGIRAIWKYNVQWDSPAPWSKRLQIDCVLFSAGFLTAAVLAAAIYRRILAGNGKGSVASKPVETE